MIFGFPPITVYIVAGALLFSAGFSSGWKIQAWRWSAETADRLAEETRILKKRQSVTEQTAVKYEQQREKIRTVTKTQIREVTKYVSTNDCPMSPGFRVFHDAAVEGKLPDPARIVDAAPVPADAVANTVAENYGTCISNAARLESLQQWVRDQTKVK